MKKIPYLHILLFICIVSFVSIPTLVFAQDGAVQINNGLKTFSGIITTFTQTIVRSLATLFATAAMVAFFFGIVQFIWGSRDGDATKAKNGKNFMLWGLIALFVMFSVWGIVNYAQRIFGIQGQNTIVIPQIELGNGKTQANPSTQGLPTGSPTANGCTQVGQRCNASTGQPGSCVRGNASRDFALYCSPDGPAPTPGSAPQTFQGGDGGCASGYTPGENGDCVNVTTGAPQPTSQTFQGGDGGCASGYTPGENGDCVNVTTGAPQP